jgi:hypothetical protein
MRTKILLLSLSVAAFSSCSTAYKSGQTPDDVYYSPVRPVEEKQNNDRNEVNNERQRDYEISMGIYDRRWRDFDDDYDYRNSPYNYCTCNCKNYGYYYNPFYHPWPVYISKYIPVNSTPRMVNLNAYTGYSNTISNTPKSGNTVNWTTPSASYNNSNNSGNNSRRNITPSREYRPSSNNTRTYTPSSNSGSSGSSNSGSSNSGSVTRPNRGG